MAEMTAAEAVRTAWKFNQPGLVRFIECQESKAKLMSQQIEYCVAMIERQAADIAKLNDKADAMRYCANCISHHVIINESKCFEGLPIDEWRFSKRAKPVDCDYVCDKWKWLEKEAEVHE